MTDLLPPDLQDAFIDSLGEPIQFGKEEIVQADRWELSGPTVVEVRLVGDSVYTDDSVRLSFKKKGRIFLSDDKKVRAVAIHDHTSLPRWTRHYIDPKGEALLVYNAYEVKHGGQIMTESWTSNAGMIVEHVSPDMRSYECSNGQGGFDRTNLRFEVSIFPADTPWLPKDIY